ncbi:hypothetical protein GF354_01720 [Candidatus Peregrinibacteria bacterium]|nr:hypothetical protein [Candidatus Peregrinibacteria bacterium]
MNDALIIDISNILIKNPGSRDFYEFCTPANFEEINLKGDLSGEVEIINSRDGLEVGVDNVDLKVELVCEKCLKEFLVDIHIKHFECTFFFKKPKNHDDPFDLYFVDMKKRKIDLNEVLRQEIILHFPSVPVCFKGCKGLCSACGNNKNETDCKCKTEENPKENKPFANLQQLINKTHG